MFTKGDDSEITAGKYISATEISCTTPNFEAFGAGNVDVKVTHECHPAVR